MRIRSSAVIATLFSLLVLPCFAHAARLVSVTPSNAGCVGGPTGPNVEAWDVQLGKSYVLRIDQITDCANGGTDATINVRVNNSTIGNADYVATKVATGIYEFSFTMPLSGCGTFPIFYCTTPGQANTGTLVGRHDTGAAQSHLRASTFGPGCANPVAISCQVTPTRTASWGGLKIHYR